MSKTYNFLNVVSMKKIFATLLILLCIFSQTKAQFSWRNDTPVYPSGNPLPASHTYLNVNAGNPPSVTIVPTSGSTLIWQSGYPQIPSSGDSRLGLGVNFPANGNNPATSFITLTFTFSSPVCGLTFDLYDIDRGGVGISPPAYTYVDEAVISGADNGGSPIATPTITPTAYASVAGNVITGIASDLTTGGSKTNIAYPSSACVKTLTITYQTGPNAQNNPNLQLISIGDMNWPGGLPVTLTSFTIQSASKAILLNWETSSEINSDRFDVQKSKDARSFENIGQLTAAFEATDTQKYQFKDITPFEGWNYYRLKAIDRDGSFAFSRIITAFYEQNETYFEIEKTLKDGSILAKTNLKEPIFEVYDLLGRPILNNVVPTEYNHYQLVIQQNNGIGIVKAVGSNGEVFTKKVWLF